MASEGYDDVAYRILEGAGLLSPEREAQIALVRETQGFSLREAAEFLLGEREEKGNLFCGFDPISLEWDYLVVKVLREDERYIFFRKEEDPAGYVSIALCSIARLQEKTDEAEEVALENFAYYVLLRLERIEYVRFEIIEVKQYKEAIRAVLIRSWGDLFVRICDNGIFQSWNA